MSITQQVLDNLKATNDRVEAVEKRLVSASKNRVDDAEILRKVFLNHPGSALGTMGIQGNDGAMLMGMGRNRRTKSCGMGDFLMLVANATEGREPLHVIEKKLGDMGSRRIEKDMAEGSGATGGYTVPPQYQNTLIKLVAEKSVLKDLCTHFPMTARELRVPTLDHTAVPASGTSYAFAGIVGTWTPESVEATKTEPSFAQVELVARDLMFTTFVSNQLLADNALGLDVLITTLFSEGMSWFIDYFMLRGNGVNQPRGVLGCPGQHLVSRENANDFTMTDAAEMLSRMYAPDRDSCVWVMHYSVLPKLIKMADSVNGRLVWINQFPNGAASEGGGAAQKLPMNLFGLPIMFTEKLPALGTRGDVMLVDFGKVLFGDRGGIQIESSRDARFTFNQTVWRTIVRYDSQPWLKAPITAADGAYKMSPYVVLEA